MTSTLSQLHDRDYQAIQTHVGAAWRERGYTDGIKGKPPARPSVNSYMKGWQAGQAVYLKRNSTKHLTLSMKLVQYCLLFYLQEAGAITTLDIHSIARSLGVSHQKIADTLQGLVKDKLVRITIG